MLATDSDALECDLMETYSIIDMRALPVERVALFSVGLRNDSRIKMKINGWNHDLQIQLLAQIIDGINNLIWMRTKDGQKGINRPKSLYSALMDDKSKDFRTFKTPEEFMSAWNS